MKARYTASSVKKALEGMVPSSGFFVKQAELDRLKCPILGEKPDGAQYKCNGNNIGCINRAYLKCQRWVGVYTYLNPRFSRDMYIFFTISDDNRDGYIDRDDTTLKWLIDEKRAINRADLTLA
jgi:hypothetical protein